MLRDSAIRDGGRGLTAIAALRRFAAPRQVPERCNLCGVRLSFEHRHLLEMANRHIICTCDPCALRFQNVIDGRFKLIPRDAFALPNFQLADEQWENLALPINLVFILRHSPDDKIVAFYPSPAGATESLLSLNAWEQIAMENPSIRCMEPDVETLLINRVTTSRRYFIAPIDMCFELVGLIRLHWKGLSGGSLVWKEVDGFFARLTSRARPEKSHA
jgi:Family of unknown function (DUF5947)